MQVVNHVAASKQKLQPGDKIPAPPSWRAPPSRHPLRTGIGYLAAMGVVKIAAGVGTFVADGPPEF